jgi:hypothetical protein
VVAARRAAGGTAIITTTPHKRLGRRALPLRLC